MYKYFTILFVCISFELSAQRDSLDNPKSAKDSIIYTQLKARMAKHKFTSEIYNFLFRDVYTRTNPTEPKVVVTSPFLPYKDKIIGNITIKSLDILGPSVLDTGRRGNGIERFTSRTLHRNTRPEIILASYLLFKEGDKLDPKVLEDNERLIRKNPTIHDARILVVPRPNVSWIVDIIVLIQDVWSINVDVTFNNTRNYGLSLEDINFRGRGDSFKNYFYLDQLDPFQHIQFGSQYTIPYIKKTFITGQAEFIWQRDLHRQALRFFRPFLTTERKYAGAFEIGHSWVREIKQVVLQNKDTTLIYPTNFYYYDAWLGRSFKITKQADKQNYRLVFAARSSGISYIERPIVSLDTNKIYWNKTTNLFSLGFSDRNYRKDFLIHGFGRTEDVPVGTLFSITGGYENTQFGQRGYGGLQYARGYYLPKNNGYVYGLFNFGSFIKSREFQQGVVSGEGDYISPLLRYRKHHFRHFLTIKYTYGFNRDPLEYLNISNREGIIGVSSNYLRGDKRLTLGIESVMFSPKSLIGFRVASFVFADFGMVSLHTVPLVNSPIYQAYGFGFRFRNENLAFNTFQVRLGYYQNIPYLSSPFRFGFEGIQPLKFQDFDITAPSIVPLR